MRLDTFAAVIFDLDGVLVDAEIWWDEVRAAFARQHGRPWGFEDRAAVMGANSAGWAAVMRERLALDVPAQAIQDEVIADMMERYERRGAPVIAGAVEAVRRIAERLPCAVASSSPPAVIDEALRSMGVRDLMSVIASSDEVARGKPAPDVFLLAAERLGVEPARSLVIEDSLNGVLAGRAAGMTVVLIPNPTIPPAPGAEAAASIVLATISELAPERRADR